MTLIAILIGVSLVCSTKIVQRAIPFESTLAVCAVAVTVMVVFQLGRMG